MAFTAPPQTAASFTPTPRWCASLGFSSFAELAQHNLEELAQSAGYPRARFKELLEKAGRVQGFEAVWVRRDGKRVWLRESAHVVRDEFGRTLYYEGTVEDITEAVEAREAYFTVVESSLQGLAILQDGRVVFGSPALEELSGRSLQELMAMTPEEVLAMVHPWGTQRDVTEHKVIEEGLKRQVPRLTVLHRVSQEIVRALADPEHAYQAVHRAVAELMPAEAFVIALRRSEDEAEAVYLFDKGGRFPAQKIPKGQGLTWHVLHTGKPVPVRDLTKEEIPNIRFGSVEPVRSVLAVPLHVEGETIGMLSTQSYQPNAFSEEDLALLELLAAHVAAALRSAQLLSALRESEARFRWLAENAPHIIYRYRLRPRPGFEYVSPAAPHIVGYTPEEHYTDPELGLKIVHPEDRPKLEALQSGEEFLGKPVELRWIHKNGRIVWTEQLNIPVFDEKGELMAIEGIARDITEWKKAEEERFAWTRTLERVFSHVVDAFASAIAKEMGWPAERVRGLRVAALLHNIGKALFVPIEILSKPGKLTDLEMALIREHPKAGYEVLKRVEFPWPVAEVVYQHHERLDGSGYPRGLKGEQILLEARILAVADVVEACLRVFRRGFRFPRSV